MPFSIGLELGLNWKDQNIPLKLTGNLANFEAKAVLVSSKIDGLPLSRLAFAWTETDKVPLLLGQTNFFMEFDVCFFRSKLAFDVSLKP